MGWAIFREIHLRVISAVLVVIASMLLLQSGLNQLKFRSLVADATASSLQVIASTVETAVQRAEQAGLSIEEITGLEDLMMRERDRKESVELISVVSPLGTPLVSVGMAALPAEDRDAVLRRVLNSGERLTSLDTGDLLYVGRLLYDSSNQPMGAVILATPTEELAAVSRLTVDRLNLAYASIFLLLALLVTPFIFVRFASVGAVFRVLGPEALESHAGDGDARHAQVRDVEAMIAEGNAAFADAERDLDQLSGSHPQKDAKTQAGHE